MSRKVVAIRDMSEGNAETGEAWQETKIFDSDDTIEAVLTWALRMDDKYSHKRITITVPHDPA